LNIFPTIFANGFNFPPPPACIAEPALQVRLFLFYKCFVFSALTSLKQCCRLYASCRSIHPVGLSFSPST
jgi:hypothetical protein